MVTPRRSYGRGTRHIHQQEVVRCFLYLIKIVEGRKTAAARPLSPDSEVSEPLTSALSQL